jgi:hypothetical protein
MLIDMTPPRVERERERGRGERELMVVRAAYAVTSKKQVVLLYLEAEA